METLDSLKSGLASGRLTGCTSLKLADNLSEFPQEILDLADSLTFLNLSNNRLSILPPEFSQLQRLQIIFFNNNLFEHYPIVLAQCPQLSMVSFKNNHIASIEPQAIAPTLRWLILTNNQLTSLPTTLGDLPKLQKLMLAGNQLSHLPQELAHCKNLELVRLSANRLSALPAWLFSMPKLSWIAYAGNPCHPSYLAKQTSETLSTISSADLQQQEVLGEGASGVIYKGLWTNRNRSDGNPNAKTGSADHEPREVAIKIFKGDITSDGSPLDEMQACIAAGAHPNLVTVLGKYRQADKTGLIFDFIPAEYKNLGNPPSLDTCTRDTYSEETRFTVTETHRIAKDIASAARHLHNRNIMHGDLYAHNILINTAGHSILGDFGAASFYDSAIVGPSLEKIEVRAFGCLLEDLLERCIGSESITSSETKTMETLKKLQKNCMQANPMVRPLFSEIHEFLKHCEA